MAMPKPIGAQRRGVEARKPYIMTRDRADGSKAFDLYARTKAGKFYIGRFDSQESAIAAFGDYLINGDVVRANQRHNSRPDRYAGVYERKTLDGGTRWDVVGREGHKPNVVTSRLGTFTEREEADAVAEKFRATGERPPKRRWRRAPRKPSDSTGTPQRKTKRATAPTAPQSEAEKAKAERLAKLKAAWSRVNH